MASPQVANDSPAREGSKRNVQSERMCMDTHICTFIYMYTHIYIKIPKTLEEEGNPSFHLDLNGKTWFALEVRSQKHKE